MKKKKINKLAAVTAMAAMFIVSAFPVSAKVKETQTVTGSGTYKTRVIYFQGSEFSIHIPKEVELEGSIAAIYEVVVKGDISSDELVTVVPDESFMMYGESTASKGDAFPASVTQEKIKWSYLDFDTNANGSIDAPGLGKGRYRGIFDFSIEIDRSD